MVGYIYMSKNPLRNAKSQGDMQLLQVLQGIQDASRGGVCHGNQGKKKYGKTMEKQSKKMGLHWTVPPYTSSHHNPDHKRKKQARWTQNAIEKLGWHILSVYQPTKKLGFSQHEPNSS